MEIIHYLLNVTLLPSSIGFLFFLVPALLFLRAARYIFRVLFPKSVRGKVVVITGASSGIGEHIAYEYATKGAILVLAARREDKLREVARRARQYGAMDVRVVVTDVSNSEDCKNLIRETIEAYHRLDHLVNNAGVAQSCLVEDIKSTAVHKEVDVTFWGAIYPTYFALEHLKRSGGRIIVVASVASFTPFPRMSLYNASKAGLVNFYDTLRVELGGDIEGITIAMPGWTESEMTVGKFIDEHGKVVYDEDTRDTTVGPSPVEPVRQVAKSIVSGAIREQRYVVVPGWYGVLLYYRVFAPDVLDLFLRLTFIAPSGQKPPSKKILEMTKAQNVLYPESITKKTT